MEPNEEEKVDTPEAENVEQEGEVKEGEVEA